MRQQGTAVQAQDVMSGNVATLAAEAAVKEARG